MAKKPFLDFEESDRLEAKRTATLKARCKEIAPKIQGLTADELFVKLDRLAWDYWHEQMWTHGYEGASETQESLRILEEKAQELADHMHRLGPSAITILLRRTVALDLYETAGIAELPDHALPYARQIERSTEEWLAGGPWVLRLKALAEYAKIKRERTREAVAGGGRTPLAERLNGSPDEWLADRCLEIAKAYGFASESIITKMVEAVAEAEVSKRKIVRKVSGRMAQTPEKKSAI